MIKKIFLIFIILIIVVTNPVFALRPEAVKKNDLAELIQGRLNDENYHFPIINATAIIDAFNRETGHNYAVADINPQSLDDVEQAAARHLQVVKWLNGKLSLPFVFYFMDLNIEAKSICEANGVMYKEDPTTPSMHEDIVNKKELLLPNPRQSFAMLGHIRFLELTKDVPEFKSKKVIAFLGGPTTTAGRIIGQDSVAILPYTDETAFIKWVLYASKVMRAYADELALAGADLICVLAPTEIEGGGRPDIFQRFLLQPLNEFFKHIKAKGMMRVFHACGKSEQFFKELADLDIDGISLDKTVNLKDFAGLRPDIVIIGNFDNIRMANMLPDEVFSSALAMMANNAALEQKGKLCPGTGCEITSLPKGHEAEALQAFSRGVDPIYARILNSA